LVYFPNSLTAETVRSLYSAEYFCGAEYLDYLADRSVHQANFRKRVKQLRRFLPAGKRVFEVGCAYGFFLELARQRWCVRGCDIAAEPCTYAAGEFGLDVECGDFLDLRLERGEVDAFCLWDTIEHLDDPARYLARISELLEPGGLVALTTGDIGSWLARLQGPRWRQIHPPTHLWYFSRDTMRRMLERHGFDVVSFRHVGMARSIGQIVYGLTSLGRPRPAALYRLCVRLGLSQVNVTLNTFDLMMVIARRRAGTKTVQSAANA
jgi:SAM-dependent methyltransferase